MEDWKRIGIPEKFNCDHVDIVFDIENKSELLKGRVDKNKISKLLKKPNFSKKVRVFSNAFRTCEFCNELISIDTENHTLSCAGIATPIVTPRHKRIKLTILSTSDSAALENMRRTGRFLRKYNELRDEAEIRAISEKRRRCLPSTAPDNG